MTRSKFALFFDKLACRIGLHSTETVGIGPYGAPPYRIKCMRATCDYEDSGL